MSFSISLSIAIAVCCLVVVPLLAFCVYQIGDAIGRRKRRKLVSIELARKPRMKNTQPVAPVLSHDRRNEEDVGLERKMEMTALL